MDSTQLENAARRGARTTTVDWLEEQANKHRLFALGSGDNGDRELSIAVRAAAGAACMTYKHLSALVSLAPLESESAPRAMAPWPRDLPGALRNLWEFLTEHAAEQAISGRTNDQHAEEHEAIASAYDRAADCIEQAMEIIGNPETQAALQIIENA